MKIPRLDFNIFQTIKNIRVAALGIGAAILFFGCENDLEEIKAFAAIDNLPVAEARQFETTLTDSGQVRFYLKAPKLLRFENDGKAFVEFPEGMELIKYDANKQIVSSITADYAKQFLAEDKWEAKNNVIATNASGDTLKTEHLFYEVEEEKIYTEEFVKIIRSDQIITGIGLVSDQSMQNWKIKNPKGTIYLAVDEQSQPAEPTKDNPDKQLEEKNIEPNAFNRQLEFEKK